VDFRGEADGFSNAVKRLLKSSSTYWLFITDSDSQYRPEDFKFFVRKFGTHSQFIKGSKVSRRDSVLRRGASYIFNRAISIYFGLPYLDFNSSHYLISRQLIDLVQIDNFTFKYAINIELTIRAIMQNYPFEICYISHGRRKFGKSKALPPKKILNYGFRTIIDVVRLKSKLF